MINNINKNLKIINNSTLIPKKYKKIICNILNDKLIPLKKNDIIKYNLRFFNYIYTYYNLNIKLRESEFNYIYRYFLLKKNLNYEIKNYYNKKLIKNKKIQKYLDNNFKNTNIILKNNKMVKLLDKKTNNLITKYNLIIQYLKIQDKKNLSTQFNFSKNIYELNIRIELNNQILNKCKEDINNYEQKLKENDIIKGIKFDKIELCMICLEDLEYGIITKCNHKFHLSCINSHTYYIIDNIDNDIEIKCPLCRSYI